MARNKRPPLTSPWKIGFLASLLPVAVGIGVGFFITRAFGFTWTWIEFHGTWSDWTFYREAFMTEMMPLAVLVPLMSLLSYFLITNAVRRYRQYVDSGLDYKNLIKSIRTINDLENEKQIKKLGNHPELRDFLLGIRRTVGDRQEALNAREAVLGQREAEASGGETLAAETDLLVNALVNARSGGFQNELAVETPELRRLVKAIRGYMADETACAANDARWGELRDAHSASFDSLSAKLAEIREEVAASERSARELESELGRLSHSLPGAPGETKGADGTGENARRAISHLDNVAQTLQALGEETRSVAINTALQAGSGNGSAESVVQLADDVRELAAKFNGIVVQWQEASELARTSFSVVAQSPRRGKEDNLAGAIDGVSSQAGLSVERAVVLSEKIRSFDQHYQDALAAFATKLSDEPAEPDDEDWSTLSATATAPAVSELVDDGEDFERQGDPSELLIGAEDTSGSAGFEQQDRLFKSTPAVDDELFVDIPDGASAVTDNEDADLAAAPFERSARTRFDDPVELLDDAPAVDADDAYGLEDEVEAPVADDDFMPGSGYPKSAPVVGAERPSATSFATSSHIEEVDSVHRPDDDAVSLYDLGAVDYEPANAHHNA